MSVSSSLGTLNLRRADSNRLVLELAGDWVTGPDLPESGLLEQEAAKKGAFQSIEFEAGSLGRWNSALVSFLFGCYLWCKDRKIEFRAEGLPPGVQRLLRLSSEVPERAGTRREEAQAPLATRVKAVVAGLTESSKQFVTFLGETALAFSNLARGTAHFRKSEAIGAMAECGPRGLGIVSLISFLVGLILAFVGAVQLTRFGASIFVADLVAVGVLREMGCIMTGIIVCGRTGAAFAAELGTMKVSEELDAFGTFAISSMEYLVLPRILALVVVTPILCAFADLIAIFGGFTVSVLLLDVQPAQYIERTLAAATVDSLLLGLAKGAVFGFLVALTGCFRGMRCGTDAAAVGKATTSAVVSGITAIVVADGLFAVLCNTLGI